jgi:hypothetical protein
MTYRSDLDALTARHAALDAEVQAAVRERDEAAHMLDQARAKARLPVLDEIRIASPCSADWSRMKGDTRVRRCGDCKQNVYNISAMTRVEAEALIVLHEGKMCLRFYERLDGTLILKDCEIKHSRRGLVAAGVAALAVAGAGLYLGLPHDRPPPPHDSRALALPPTKVDPPVPAQHPHVKAPEREIRIHQGVPPRHDEVITMGRF